MDNKSFGIYIKTHKPDYYLTKPLLASLKKYAPGVDITIVADDDYTGNDLFGKKVLHLKDPFLQKLTGYFRKLWVFFGQYERFLYLDADQLAVHPLEPLLVEIKNAKIPFFIVNKDPHTDKKLHGNEEMKRALFWERIGDTDLLEELDPEFRWEEIYPFNSGNFGGYTGVIHLDLLKDVFNRAQEMHKEKGLPPLHTSRKGLFSGDQGLINYLIYKQGIKPVLKENLYCWGGVSVTEYIKRKNKTSEKPLYFIHWAGCPRPTYLRINVPGGEEWVHFNREYYKNNGYKIIYLIDTFENIIFDLKKRLFRLVSILKNKLYII